MSEYTDQERVQIARKEYKDYAVGDPVKINGDKTIVGYVSEVNHKPNGEDSYIVTNTTDPAKATQVTVLYQGSASAMDWLATDIPDGAQLALNGSAPVHAPIGQQLRTSAWTLNDAMRKYPNAHFDVYGHSLGSMDAQYALASIAPSDVKRIDGAYVYEGPNMYTFLNDDQRETITQFAKTGAIHNYVDGKDLVPLGYRGNTQHIGTLFRVNSKFASDGGSGWDDLWSVIGGPAAAAVIDFKHIGTLIKNQHMWGGYQFDKDGTLKFVDSDESGELNAIYDTTGKQLKQLNALRGVFAKSGGSLSDSERIYLDTQETAVMLNGMRQLIEEQTGELKALVASTCQTYDQEWSSTRADATAVGTHLSGNQVMNALAAGGATESSIRDTPKRDAKHVLDAMSRANSQFSDLLAQIERTAQHQVDTDRELASEISRLQ